MHNHPTVFKYTAVVMFFALAQAVKISGQQLYCGYSHTLAVKHDSTLWAWGNNSQGQVGNGNLGQALYPVQVSGLNGIIDAAGGYEHSLAIKKDGTAWSWGRNSEGQLGNGTTTQQKTPVRVSSLINVVNVAAGYYHSLAIKADGTLWVWGKNNRGQLGNGTIVSSSTAVQLSAVTGVVDVAGGEEFSVALKSDGTVWSWGYNVVYQLGDGTGTQRTTPVQVTGGFTATAIATGRKHTLALKADGTVWAWGYNLSGQLGNGNTLNQRVPVKVNGLNDAIAIAAGENHSLAVKSDGTVWAWGYNGQGQLGIGTTDEDPHSIPVQTGKVTSGTIVRAGSHSMSINADESLWAWGNNASGQFGNGINTNSYWPQPSLFTFAPLSLVARPTFSPDGGAYTTSQDVIVSCSTAGATIHYTTNGIDPTNIDPVIASGSSLETLNGIAIFKARAFKTGLAPSNVKATVYQVGERVTSGYSHSLAIRSGNILWAWGNNARGQLGIGSLVQQIIPIQVNSLNGVKDAAGGYEHTLTLINNGTVWASGRNSEGQLGDGTITQRTTPVQVTGLNNVVNIGAGYYHSLAINADGTLWSWGKNNVGQLGIGNTVNSLIPVKIDTLSGVTDVAAGEEFSVALKADGTVWTWGENIFGQLGDGTNSQHNFPVQVSSVFDIIAISAGRYHVLALRADGTVWAWGLNFNGQLGDGTINTSGQKIPVQVKSLNDVIAIAAGEKHSLAVKRDGTSWAWGYNLFGQLGDFTDNNSRKLPVQVPELNNVYSLCAGTHTLFLTQGSGVHLFWANGPNGSGQLGDSTRIAKNFRTLVHFPLDENNNGLPEWQDYQYLNTGYADMDRDGLLDWKEVLLYATDPHNFDTNGDGLSDGANVLIGLDPKSDDTDRDGIPNLQEVSNGTSPILRDTDGDRISDKIDAFPLDRSRKKIPARNTSDTIRPVIILQEPKL